MGIPQLRKHLEPYAERAVIELGSAVLDGPSLAYHVLGLCWRTTRKSSPFEQPSYDLLAKTSIAWLSRIQACGLSISAIYFDSYLPSSKRPERIQRLIKASRDLIKYHSAFPTGVPKGGSQNVTASAHVDLFPSAWPANNQPKPPSPSFLVPAVIDSLRGSTEFGPLVKLVPGEADGFCAQHVRQNGGTVLTSDSDLLVHDLGEAGGVVFFADMDLDADSQTLMAAQYRPPDICRRLFIKPETGFQHLAFEIRRDSHLTLKQAAERAKRSEAASASEEEYSAFINEYRLPEVASKLETDQVSALDPRVSEIVLRSRVPGTISPGSESDPTPDTRLEMYLPFLFDCPIRTSAWEASKPVRQLAYAALQTIRGSNIPSVSEMRRLQTVCSGLAVDVPKLTDLDQLSTSLLALLANIEAGIAKPELVWVMLAIYQDIIMTLDRARGYPLSLELLGHEARGQLNSRSWDFVHFLAQTQATHYSLRMLHQVLNFSAEHHGALSTPMSELARFLTRLPSLPEFPFISNFAETLQVLREAGGLSCLKSLCAEHEDIIPHIEAIERPPESKRSKKRKSTQPVEENPRPRSSNPFDLLARTEE